VPGLIAKPIVDVLIGARAGSRPHEASTVWLVSGTSMWAKMGTKKVTDSKIAVPERTKVRNGAHVEIGDAPPAPELSPRPSAVPAVL
jgi:hypothetical protein